jgi:hypothetical protein
MNFTPKDKAVVGASVFLSLAIAIGTWIRKL